MPTEQRLGATPACEQPCHNTKSSSTVHLALLLLLYPQSSPHSPQMMFQCFSPQNYPIFPHVFVPKFQLNSPQHLQEFCWTQALHLERMEEKGKWGREANSHFCLGTQMHRHAALTADKEPNPCNCCSIAGWCGLLPDASGPKLQGRQKLKMPLHAKDGGLWS